MKFETIDEVCLEVERRAASLDGGVAAMVYLYKSASVFVTALNLIILIILLAFTFLTEYLKGYEQLIFSIYISVVAFEMIASTYNRRVIDHAVTDMKFNIALQCFSKYVKYDELQDWEKEKILSNTIISHSGLHEVKDK